MSYETAPALLSGGLKKLARDGLADRSFVLSGTCAALEAKSLSSMFTRLLGYTALFVLGA